jgi:hypothetical protein
MASPQSIASSTKVGIETLTTAQAPERKTAISSKHVQPTPGGVADERLHGSRTDQETAIGHTFKKLL